MDYQKSTRRNILQVSGAIGLVSLAGCSGQSGNNTTQTAPGPELVYHHTLDGDFSDTVNGIAGNPAATGVEFVQDRGDTVLELAGSGAGDNGGYYDVPYSGITQHISDGDPLTTALWVKPTDNQNWEIIFNGAGCTIDTRNGNLRLRWYNPSTAENEFLIEKDVSTHLPNGEWTHVVGTVQPDDEARLYINGERIGSTPIGDSQGFQQKENTDTIRVGFHPVADDGGYDSHFGGRIDEVQFYKGQIGDSEVEQLYNSQQ